LGPTPTPTPNPTPTPTPNLFIHRNNKFSKIKSIIKKIKK